MPEQVEFYVLSSTDITSKLICACRVISKAYRQGLKVYIQTDDSGHAEMIDQVLWSFSPASFVPHTVIKEGVSIDEMPVLIGTTPAPPGWEQMLISLTREVVHDISRYLRIADFISDDEQDKKWGRERFRAFRRLGIEPKTHLLNG